MPRMLSIFLLSWPAVAAVITGIVTDTAGQPVAGATVQLEDGTAAKTGEDGAYRLDPASPGPHELSARFDGFTAIDMPVRIGSDARIDLRFTSLAPLAQSTTVSAAAAAGDILNPDPAQRFFLHDELLAANPGHAGAPVSIPGLPVETASGGIKAPQYFAPGVAGDHGEPIAQFIQVGSYLLSNNLSSNAHGNGYADPNVIIPMAIESVETDGGAFNVREGNHAVNQAVAYGLRSRMEPAVDITGDQHDVDATAGWSPGTPATHAWIALEAAYGDGFLQTPERRRQFKFNALRAFDFGSHHVTLFAIGYYGASRVPGLVPIGIAGLHDTIDPRQQDQTHTGEIAANDLWRFGSADELHLSGFFRTYNLSLYSDFGDGLIRQSEFRTATGAQTAYVKKIGETLTIMAGMDFSREAPRRLDLDRYSSANPAALGPFQPVTANNVTLSSLSPYLSLNGRLTSWLRFDLGWRRDQIGFNNSDLLIPARSFDRWTGVNSPKATLNIIAPQSVPLPSLSFSAGQAFFTNDPRMGVGSASGTLVSRAHSYQLVAMETILGTELRVTAGHLTQEQSLAKIDPDTGSQFDEGPSRNRYVTFSALRRFRIGMVQASLSKADARDLLSRNPIPEAPRLIWDVMGTIDRLPLHLKARGEFEQVGRKPLGDGFVGVAVNELRGALFRPFWKGHIDAGVHFLFASGYSGQTTEVLALPGADPSECIVGVRIPSYAGLSLTLHF